MVAGSLKRVCADRQAILDLSWFSKAGNHRRRCDVAHHRQDSDLCATPHTCPIAICAATAKIAAESSRLKGSHSYTIPHIYYVLFGDGAADWTLRIVLRWFAFRTRGPASRQACILNLDPHRVMAAPPRGRFISMAPARCCINPSLDAVGITIHTGWYVDSAKESETQGDEAARS